MMLPTGLSLLSLLCLVLSASADTIQLSIPAEPSNSNVVQSNFLGISFELSFMDQYFGNDTSTIPKTTVNYLSALRARIGQNPVLIRIGGNSMDSSAYASSQGSPMVQLVVADNINSNNQPVTYGPVLWQVLKSVAASLGGASYLVGLPLLDPNNTDVPLIAGDATTLLGNTLNGFLLGNEPDLYSAHGFRPNLPNYDIQDYFQEFSTFSNYLTNTSAGDILKRNIGGPTICCGWDLDDVLSAGYAKMFSDTLKYISLQHYPQNNCFGSYEYNIPYYIQHSNVVDLAAWQQSGINMTISNTTGPKLIMSEFNSASCGGIEGVSDTFAVGSLWTVDYALQLASVGYSEAYIHTREQGISYNLFDPPAGPNGGPGAWTTNPPYYALLVVAEALQLSSNKGSIVVDLDVNKSMSSDANSTVGGYAVYDASDSSVQRVVLFNYNNFTSATFSLPSNAFASSKDGNLTVKYLVGANMQEKTDITWGGQTLAGVGDGNLVAAKTWPNKQLNCTNGCSVDIPATALAVIFANIEQSSSNSSSSTAGSNDTNKSGAHSLKAFNIWGVLASTVVVIYTCAAHMNF